MTVIQDFLQEKIKLPSPPGVALKILEAVRQEDSSFDNLAKIIKVDPAYGAGNFHSQGAQRFANKVKAATNGELTIVLHPGASLGFKGCNTKK